MLRRKQHRWPRCSANAPRLIISLVVALLTGCSQGVPATVLRLRGRSAEVTTFKVQGTTRYGPGAQTVRNDDVTVSLDFSRLILADADLKKPVSYTIHLGRHRLEQTSAGQTELWFGSGERLRIPDLQPRSGSPVVEESSDLPAVMLPVEIGFRLNIAVRALCSEIEKAGAIRDEARQLTQALLDKPQYPLFGQIASGGPFTGTLELTEFGRQRLQRCMREEATRPATQSTAPSTEPDE